MPVISQALRLKAFNPHCTQLFLQLPRCWIWHLYLLAHTLPSILEDALLLAGTAASV